MNKATLTETRILPPRNPNKPQAVNRGPSDATLLADNWHTAHAVATLMTLSLGSLAFNPRGAEVERFVDLVQRIDDAIGIISTSNGVGAGISVDGITAVSTQGDVVAAVTTQHVVTTTGDECLATSEADQ